jgi:hypothetical protein
MATRCEEVGILCYIEGVKQEHWMIRWDNNEKTHYDDRISLVAAL